MSLCLTTISVNPFTFYDQPDHKAMEMSDSSYPHVHDGNSVGLLASDHFALRISTALRFAWFFWPE